MKIFKSLGLASMLLALSVSVVSAKVGVGVGLGKVQLDETLSPGGVYNLPSLPVLNTGDEDGEYEVEVTFLTDQEELRPDASWFSFTPQSFHLDAGSSQLVEVALTLPVDARPGDYFAFLEAHPVVKAEGTTIGVAAATKLNFTVKPSGILGAAVERVRSLIETNAPTSYYVLGIAGGIIILASARRYFTVSVGLKKERKTSKEEKKDEAYSPSRVA